MGLHSMPTFHKILELSSAFNVCKCPLFHSAGQAPPGLLHRLPGPTRPETAFCSRNRFRILCSSTSTNLLRFPAIHFPLSFADTIQLGTDRGGPIKVGMGGGFLELSNLLCPSTRWVPLHTHLLCVNPGLEIAF